MQPHDVTPDTDDAAWQDCEKGALRQYVRAHRTAMRRKRQVATGGLIASCLVLILAGATVAIRQSQVISPLHGGLTCRQVQGSIDRFFAGELREDYREHLLVHLRECPRCEHLYQERADELAFDMTASMPRPLPWQQTAIDGSNHPERTLVLGHTGRCY